jgi:hypothetical protein
MSLTITLASTINDEDPYIIHLKQNNMWFYVLALKASARDDCRYFWEIQNHHDSQISHNPERYSKLAGIY